MGLGDFLSKIPSVSPLGHLINMGQGVHGSLKNTQELIDQDMAWRHAYHDRAVAEWERSNAPSRAEIVMGLKPKWETSPWGPQPAPFNPAISNTPTYDQTPRLGGTVAAGPSGQYDPMRSANYSILPLIDGPFDPRMTAPMPRKLPPMPYLAEPPARTGGDERLLRERDLPEPTQYDPSPRDLMRARAVQALVNMPSTQPNINMTGPTGVGLSPRISSVTSEPKEATPREAAIAYGKDGPFGDWSGVDISLQDLLMDYLGVQNMAQVVPYNRLWAANPMAVTGNPQRSYSGGY